MKTTVPTLPAGITELRVAAPFCRRVYSLSRNAATLVARDGATKMS